MIKKIFSVIMVSLIVCFSFYYTDLASIIIKENDPLMKQIRNISSDHVEEAVNAQIDNLYIIPGVSGSKIDKDESYYSMKRYGAFNENLLVYEEVTPEISISNTYDKFICSGNPNKMMVSLVFLVEDYSYITEIINILDSKQVKATFFIKDNIIGESTDIIKLINNSNHQIELYSDNYAEVKKYVKIINNITKKKNNYCLSLNGDTTVLNNCYKNKMHTILPSIITSNFPYNDVKEKLESGSIIKLDNNKIVLRELNSIINYIKQKGYKITSLSNILEERKTIVKKYIKLHTIK